MDERTCCTCHGIDINTFREACEKGANTVKACFKHIGCMPKCANCIPEIRTLLAEQEKREPHGSCGA